jgi:hypothetical protein
MYILFIIFLILLAIHYYVITHLSLVNKTNKQYLEEIEFNIKNKDKIEQIFSKIINERVKLLNTTYKNNYNSWIEYNNKNNIINIDGYQYFIFIVEKINSTDDFILKVFPDNQFKDFTLNNVANLANQRAYFTKYTIDKNLYSNMYNSSHDNTLNRIKYVWVDPANNNLVEKMSIYNKFNANDNVNGVIGLGYDYQDIKYSDTFFYYDIMDKRIIISIILFIFIYSLFNYNRSKNYINKIKVIFFLIITNLFITYFMSSKEELTTTKLELEKLNGFNQSVLSISFLFAVNIFIIETMIEKSYKHRFIFIESALLFVISLVLILISIFKNVNYKDLQDLIKGRIINQFFFNFAIIINIFILINFIIYVIVEKKLTVLI